MIAAQPEPRAQRGSAEAFTLERLEKIRRLEAWHFWFVSRRRLVEHVIERHFGTVRSVLDVGCGTGSLVVELGRGERPVVGLDLRMEGLRAVRHGLPRVLVVQGDAGDLPLARESFGAVTLLDILEHVDDAKVMREAWRVLQPGGLVLGMVPAFPLLWGERDSAAGHQRRYRQGHVRRLVAETGFFLLDVRYFQFTLFPILALLRLLGGQRRIVSDLEERPGALNRALRAINLAEVALSRVVRWPWGSSLVFVCRKITE